MGGEFYMDKIKILAVDDEESVLKIIKEFYHRHDLTTETSSLKAAQIIQKEEFDIVIVDYQMPQLNGIELLEKIKEVYKDRKYVSIFCTAYGTIHLFKAELVRGLFNYFIEKPFNYNSLKEIMKKSFLRLGKIKNNGKQQVNDDKTK